MTRFNKLFKRLVNGISLSIGMLLGRSIALIWIGSGRFGVPLPVSPSLKNSLTKGTYEGDERLIIANLLESSDRVLELGAAIGVLANNYGDVAAGPHIAIEANPALIPLVKDNLHRNGIVNVEIIHGVADTAEGTSTFNVHQDFYSSSRDGDGSTTVTVDKIDINKIIDRNNINVIISDIEGGEYDVFDRVDLSQIDKLVIEIHNAENTGASLLALLQKIQNAGFVFLVRRWRGNVVVFEKIDRHSNHNKN